MFTVCSRACVCVCVCVFVFVAFYQVLGTVFSKKSGGSAQDVPEASKYLQKVSFRKCMQAEGDDAVQWNPKKMLDQAVAE